MPRLPISFLAAIAAMYFLPSQVAGAAFCVGSVGAYDLTDSYDCNAHSQSPPPERITSSGQATCSMNAKPSHSLIIGVLNPEFLLVRPAKS